MSAPDLAALVGSRLCHDLVSPLGAIGNGVELLRLIQPASPELDMVNEAVAAAQARLRLFRLAFGAASEGQSIRPAEVNEALAGLAAHGRITLANGLGEPLPRPQARRLALAALCVESALPWGGSVSVEPMALRATATRLRLDPALWEALTQRAPLADPTPATVHFALLAADGPVTLTRDEAGFTLRL